MHPALRDFFGQYLGVVCTTLLAFALMTALSVPDIFIGHSAEARLTKAAVQYHLT